MIHIDVFTANEECLLTPKEAIGRYFISLGSQHHNYGKCYELICWINTSDNQVEDPYLSLIYTFEFNNCKRVDNVSIEYAIMKLKLAIHSLANSNNKSLYRDYMLISSRRCLDHLLTDYSFYKYQVYMAKKIQKKWLYHYYTPTSKICIKIRTRQFLELNEDTYLRSKLTWE